MDIRTDPMVNEIKHLAPEVSIVGGTFADWLPAPKDVQPTEHAGHTGTRQAGCDRQVPDRAPRGIPDSPPLNPVTSPPVREIGQRVTLGA